jgi:hypothetical protein
MAGIASFLPKRRLDLGHAQTRAARIDPKLQESSIAGLGWPHRHFRMDS